jgi:hypothetical protein
MSWLGRLLSTVTGLPASVPLVEAAGAQTAAESDRDRAWRPIGQQSDRDLTPLDQVLMQDLAVYSWERNRLANRLIELPIAYLFAGGVRLEVDDEEAQGWLDAFWNDPINNWRLKLPKRARELAIFGEQLWPITRRVDGHIRITAIDPGRIGTVHLDPDNDEMAIGVTVRGPEGTGDRTYRTVMLGDDAELFGPRAQALRAQWPEEAVFIRINDLRARGRSDLLSAVDWADAVEELLFGEVEGAELRRTTLWDVTLTGADQEMVDARAKQLRAPKGNTVRVHNENEVWRAEVPKLETGDVVSLLREGRMQVFGGATVPMHWFGDGENANRASAEAMGDPTLKVLAMRQDTWKAILEMLATLVIRSRLAVIGRETVDLATDPAYRPRAVMPELTAKDATRYAAALGQVVAASAAAVDGGLMTERSAVTLIGLIAGELGLTIDPAKELEEARAERARRSEQAAAADMFTLPPDLAGDPRTGDPNAPDPTGRGAP